MAIGYACLTYGNQKYKFRSCTLKTATRENLLKIISHNLETLSSLIDYNISSGILLFRISSDIIPFASHSVNDIVWQEEFSQELEKIGKKIVESDMRVSMHPGQYTVLNSKDGDVVSRAVSDLRYHADFLNSLNLNKTHKIVIHIGGVYGDKKSAIDRFKRNYAFLDSDIRDRLIIENDEKSYTASEVLSIGVDLSIPVVFDNLHHSVNNADSCSAESQCILDAAKTWGREDGLQKIHYSQQKSNGRTGAHSTTIYIRRFLDFYNSLPKEVDIMLEVKDKNLSAVKCINTVSNAGMEALKLEWSKYKWEVHFHSLSIFKEISKLFEADLDIEPLEFYSLIETALDSSPSLKSVESCFLSAKSFIEDKLTEKEREKFDLLLKDSFKDIPNSKKLKSFLYRLSLKHQVDELLESYFFHDI